MGDTAQGMRASFRTFLLAALVVAVAALPRPAEAQLVLPGTQVRVLLAVVNAAVIDADGAHHGVIDGEQRFSTALPLEWPLQALGGRVLVDGVDVGTSLHIAMDEGLVTFDGQRYRGSLRFTAAGDMLQVVNVLDIESYLRGVVPSEMSASWQMEALKAQAVAARSYTMTSLDPTASYDLCATVDCQVYRGVEAEHERTDAAILATAGVVVTYQGVTAHTYYHADSGGVVASSGEVWGTALPYLVTLADAPANSPHRSWQARLDGGSVGAALAAAGLPVGTVTGLRVVRLSESGRVAELEVTGTARTRLLSGVVLREQARGWGLKSMRFRVQGGLVVNGDGWGHGVGMSQYGARALANAGYDFGSILAFYYPATNLTRFVAGGP
jgi:stage II sporulation protein D